MVLHELKIGDKALIINILDDKNIDKQRLSDLGIVTGTEITALFRSPFGNPTAYLIRGTVFALRDDISENIVVEMVKRWRNE